MMQDENIEAHDHLNFDQSELIIRTLEKDKNSKKRRDFGTGEKEKQGAESRFAVKNRVITPNPFYHA